MLIKIPAAVLQIHLPAHGLRKQQNMAHVLGSLWKTQKKLLVPDCLSSSCCSHVGSESWIEVLSLLLPLLLLVTIFQINVNKS